jgi:ssDNA-binding Zn-finger/Zn-ribbon topoisomerase 1
MTTGNGSSYDEREALTAYVLEWYGHLMTESECEGMRAIHFEEKARVLGERDEDVAASYRRLGRRFAETRAARKALRMGADEFRRRVCDRILAVHRREVMINRCPRCRRIVRTPRAEQCFWCGNDWHPKKSNSAPS